MQVYVIILLSSPRGRECRNDPAW